MKRTSIACAVAAARDGIEPFLVVDAFQPLGTIRLDGLPNHSLARFAIYVKGIAQETADEHAAPVGHRVPPLDLPLLRLAPVRNRGKDAGRAADVAHGQLEPSFLGWLCPHQLQQNRERAERKQRSVSEI